MFAIQEEQLYSECGARLNNFYLSKLLCIFPSLFAKNLNKARYNIYGNLLPVFSTEAEADPGGGLRGLQPPLWEVFKLVWLPMSIPFSYQK